MQLPRYHRLREPFYRLAGNRCRRCEEAYFPSRIVCRSCGSRELDPVRYRGAGTLYSWTRMAQTPRGFEAVGPCTLGMVRLEEGPLITAQLTDVEGADLWIGMPLEMTTRKISESAAHGYIVYGYKFRPRIPIEPTGPEATPAGGPGAEPKR